MRLIATLFLIFGLSGSALLAQSTMPDTTQSDRIAELEAELELTRSMFSDVSERYTDLLAREDAGLLDASRALNQAKIDHLAYEERLRAHALNILNWQLASSYIVLALVVAVTGLGVFLSYREVMAAVKAPDKVVNALQSTSLARADGDAPAPDPSGNGTTLIVSAQKLQVTSAITGVVILVLSLAFLYLFVKEVLEVVPRDFSTDLAPGATLADPVTEGAPGG